MKPSAVIWAVWLLVLLQSGCAEPAQLGGLGVFNPRGLSGRMAIANRVNGSAARQSQQVQPAPAPSTTTSGEHP